MTSSLFDLPRRERPRWFRQLVCAIQVNASDLALWGVVYGADGIVLDPAASAEAAARLVASLPYRWEPYRPQTLLDEPQQIVDLQAARRRGFAACGEGTAAAAAAALIAGGECELCYEATELLPGYAHVRIDVSGRPVDAFPEASFDVPCVGRERITRELVRWPVADADMLVLLDESRRLAGPP
jgi:hypothetical protein